MDLMPTMRRRADDSDPGLGVRGVTERLGGAGPECASAQAHTVFFAGVFARGRPPVPAQLAPRWQGSQDSKGYLLGEPDVQNAGQRVYAFGDNQPGAIWTVRRVGLAT
jgi:hypothetical protein